MDTLSGTAGLGSLGTAGPAGVTEGAEGGRGAHRLVLFKAAVLSVVDRAGLSALGS